MPRTIADVDAELAAWVAEAADHPHLRGLARKMCDLWLAERTRISAAEGVNTAPCR